MAAGSGACGEQDFGHAVDRDIRRLGGEHDGDQQLERGFVVELGARIWVAARNRGQERADIGALH